MTRKPGFRYQTWLKRSQKVPKWPDSIQVIGVNWEDASWVDSDAKDAGTVMIFTVGVLIEATEREIKIAHEVHGDGDERGVTTVPASLVRRIIPAITLKAFSQ